MKMIVPGRVSVIVPVHNRPKRLAGAVESVLAQSYANWELIIVDDASTDDTVQAAQQMTAAVAERCTVLRQGHNQGPGPARQRGLEHASGEFIQYLDSDDRLWPHKLERQIAALRRQPECDSAYGWTRFVREGEAPGTEPVRRSGQRLPTLFPWLLVYRWWTIECALHRHEMLREIGPWGQLRWSQDWEYDGRIAARGTRLAHVPEFVSDYVFHSDVRQGQDADWTTPDRADNRWQLVSLLAQYAQQAAVPLDSPQMQHFARWVFMVARWCSHAGLEEQAAGAMELAISLSLPAKQIDLRLYQQLARTVGWRRAAQLVELRRYLPGQAGADTLPLRWADF